MRAPKLHYIEALALGTSLTLNIVLLPSLDNSPRALDLVALVLGVIGLFRALATGRVQVATLLRASVLGVLLLPWLVRSLVTGDIGDLLMSCRWMLFLAAAVRLHTLSQEPGPRALLQKSLFWGAVLNVGILALQSAGYLDATFAWGLAARDAAQVSYSGAFRAPGLYGHPNGSAAVVAFSLAFALALYSERGRGAFRVLVSGIAISLATVFTLSRSSLLVSGFVFAVWALVGNQTRFTWRRLAGPALFIGLCILLTVVGPPGGWERWTNERNISSNSAERMQTTLFALELALEHPLGMGFDYREAVISGTGYGATHNAWLQLALVAGLPLALLVLCGTVYWCAMLLRERRWEAWVALEFMGLSFFEEHFNNPLFVTLSFWLVLGWLSRGRQRRISVSALHGHSHRDSPAVTDESDGATGQSEPA